MVTGNGGIVQRNIGKQSELKLSSILAQGTVYDVFR